MVGTDARRGITPQTRRRRFPRWGGCCRRCRFTVPGQTDVVLNPHRCTPGDGVRAAGSRDARGLPLLGCLVRSERDRGENRLLVHVAGVGQVLPISRDMVDGEVAHHSG